MYLMLLAILLALIGASVIFWMLHMEKHPKWMETVVALVLIPSLVIFGIWCGALFSAADNRADNQEEYRQLILYQHTVENSTNEYLRFDYYNRVQEWNERYNEIKEMEVDPWVSWFYFDLMENCGPVDFVLHGDEMEVTNNG